MSLQVTGQFTSNGNSQTLMMAGKIPELGCNFRLSLSGLAGTSATVTVQCSFDGGNTWNNVQAYTADIETYGFEPAANVLYRLACSGMTTGSIKYALGF